MMLLYYFFYFQIFLLQLHAFKVHSSQRLKVNNANIVNRYTFGDYCQKLNKVKIQKLFILHSTNQNNDDNNPPPKPRGRPRKNPLPINDNGNNQGSKLFKPNKFNKSSKIPSSISDGFNPKNLLNADFLNDDINIENLLPNLDEDFAKLEANLNDLGEFDGFELNDLDEFSDSEMMKSLNLNDMDGLGKQKKRNLDDLLNESSKFNVDDFLTKASKEMSEENDGKSILDDDDSLNDIDMSDLNLSLDDELDLSALGLDDDFILGDITPDLNEEIGDTEMDKIKNNNDNKNINKSNPISNNKKEPKVQKSLKNFNINNNRFDEEDMLDDDNSKNKSSYILANEKMIAKNKKAMKNWNNQQAKSSPPLVIDGVELDDKEFDLGVEPPPLEEFKRLMESLGSESMFDDDVLFENTENPGDVVEEDEALERDPRLDFNRTSEEKAWVPNIYEGGNPEETVTYADERASIADYDIKLDGYTHDDPAVIRAQIVAVVTDSPENSTALNYVRHVFDYLKNGTNNDPRICYQLICVTRDDNKPQDELIDVIQMWVESYNTYHLIDGAAMKEAWGAIMPHIILSEKNLQALLDQVRWALEEDAMNGVLLTPRLRKVRFRGGAQEMNSGFNTQQLDSEFSVVSVR
eukprot:gene4683-6578_t